MAHNFVGEPVLQLQQIALKGNALTKLVKQMLNVLNSYQQLLQVYQNVLLMVIHVQIEENNVHSLREMMKHAFYSQLLMVHAKPVLFQQILLFVLLEFVMKPLTHLQQMINVQSIIQLVKQQVEDVRVLFHVES